MNKSSLLREMHKVCRQYSVEFLEPDWDLRVGVSPNLLSGSQPLNGLRHKQENGSLGWYVYAGDVFPVDDDAFVGMCAKHLIKRELSFLKYLALPPGWRFLSDAKGYEDVWFDETLLEH